MASVQHPFATFPVLANEQLTLRELVPADAPAVGDISFYDGAAAATDEGAIAIMERIERDDALGLSGGPVRPGRGRVLPRPAPDGRTDAGTLNTP